MDLKPNISGSKPTAPAQEGQNEKDPYEINGSKKIPEHFAKHPAIIYSQTLLKKGLHPHSGGLLMWLLMLPMFVFFALFLKYGYKQPEKMRVEDLDFEAPPERFTKLIINKPLKPGPPPKPAAEVRVEKPVEAAQKKQVRKKRDLEQKKAQVEAQKAPPPVPSPTAPPVPKISAEQMKKVKSSAVLKALTKTKSKALAKLFNTTNAFSSSLNNALDNIDLGTTADSATAASLDSSQLELKQADNVAEAADAGDIAEMDVKGDELEKMTEQAVAIVGDVPPDAIEGGTGEGGLDINAVLEAVKRSALGIKKCYDVALKLKPNLAGKIVLRFKVLNSGKVEEESMQFTSTDINEEKLLNCIKSRVKIIHFPRFMGTPGIINYPFNFSPQN